MTDTVVVVKLLGQGDLEKSIGIASVALDVWGMNMALACHVVRFRMDTVSRTDTIYGGNPLGVFGRADGVCVNRNWFSSDARADVTLSVHGVPSGT